MKYLLLCGVLLLAACANNQQYTSTADLLRYEQENTARFFGQAEVAGKRVVTFNPCPGTPRSRTSNFSSHLDAVYDPRYGSGAQLRAHVETAGSC